ncbi:MAG TPA: hypothetical protein VHH11_13770 [Gammaproteobacteria bacterium]|nr:hypothetical protein [Gammaproteobacteria bacterium]
MQTIKVQNEPRRLFGIQAVTQAPGGPNACVAPAALFSMVNVRLLFSQPPVAPVTIAWEFYDGFDTAGDLLFAGTIATPAKIGVRDLWQYTGLLTQFLEIRAGLVAAPGAPDVILVTLDVQLDRCAGDTFQMRWGGDVTKTFPVAPYKVLP